MRLIFILFLTSYFAGILIPASRFWYDAGQPLFGSVRQGETPPVTFPRTIKRVSHIRYSAVVRGGPMGHVECEGHSQPFDYKPSSARIVTRDLVWWTGDPRCALLPVGAYEVATCWTIIWPLGDLIPARWRKRSTGDFSTLHQIIGWWWPPKSVCRTGVFVVTTK